MRASNCRYIDRVPCTKALEKTAFVTLVMLDDGYIPGALAAGYSLRKQNPDFLLICMVTEEISSYGRDLLRLFYDCVLLVEKIFIPCRRMKFSHYLPYVFTKLNTLLLRRGGIISDDLEKVIFFDADVLPLGCYDQLTSLPAPAGIINEYKSHFIMVNESNQYNIKDYIRRTGKWHWHNIYESICPHGSKIPRYITDRVGKNPQNMGIHGALLVMEPSIDEFNNIMRDLNNVSTRNMIRKFAWPEMQYLTLRWSGLWINIDLKYCGFKGFPSMELLYGTHFAGEKPWNIMNTKFNLNLVNHGDYKIWYDYYLQMYEEYYDKFINHKKITKLARAIVDAAGIHLADCRAAKKRRDFFSKRKYSPSIDPRPCFY